MAAGKSKKGREKFKLQSTESDHFYTVELRTKGLDPTKGKLELSKFDPVLRRHVLYKQTKLK